uniref:Uncharacterized protein n=1 Tax=Melopsittacus undulatus TaxID=13146 RepID=A0A8V5GCV0_MELUD
MNDAELVNGALAVLAEVSPDPDLEPQPRRGTGRKRCPGNAAEHRPRFPGPFLRSRRLPGLEQCSCPSRTGWEDSQRDVLKYVREIFFS